MAGAGRRNTSARAGVERAIAWGFVVIRAIALLQTLVATGAVVFSLRLGADVTKPSIDEVSVLLATIESVALCGWFLRKGSLLPAGIPLLADVVFASLMLAAMATYTHPEDRASTWAAWSFAFTLSTAGLAGATLSRLRAVCGVSLLLALIYASVTVLPNLGVSNKFVITGAVNSLAYFAFGGAMWVIARLLRSLAQEADDARQRVKQLERDRARGVVHDVLPFLRVDGLLAADPEEQLARVTDTLHKLDQLRAYVDGTDRAGDVEVALRSVAQLFGSLDLVLKLDLDEPVELDEEVAFHMRQAVETALANVRASAPSAQVLITARADPESVLVHVVDDGPGFDSHLAPPGYGISETLGRQLSHTGGRAVVTSELGMGTRVEIFIPRSAP